jgi:uncharacterized protein (TIGR00299 family) protein
MGSPDRLRTLVLEPIGGIAGDMTLAALLHLGEALGLLAEQRARLDELLVQLAAAAGGELDLAGVRLQVEEAWVCGIRSLHAEVLVPEAVRAKEPHHRPWRVIRDLLGRTRMPEGARARALAAFARLAEAEGAVHGIAPEEVEFHEVGSVDAIVDLAGSALLLELLAPARVLCLPLPSGGGLGRSAHGPIPFPAPATLRLLHGRTLRPSGPGERVTPTGAALVAALTEEVEALPELRLCASGYGAGSKRWDDAPNLLRAVLGEAERSAPPSETLWQLEANLDDTTPQLLAHALAALLAAGARDAWIAPLTMKKGRPGHLLAALVDEPLRPVAEELFFRETSTLGLRAFRVERSVLERRFAEVQTPWGPVRVKLGLRGGARLNAAPEYEDCAALAQARGVPLKEVMAAALAALQNV